MTDIPPFEIPAPVRELAEKNVEQARQAYSQYMDMARKAQDMLTQSSGAAVDSTRDVQGKAMRFAQDNLDASFAFAAELARARDLKEAMEIQARYAQRQMQTYAAQSQDLGRSMTDAVQKMQKRT